LDSTEPRACRTALEVKFSDAMRTREERWRAFSASIRERRVGSASERGVFSADPAEEARDRSAVAVDCLAVDWVVNRPALDSLRVAERVERSMVVVASAERFDCNALSL
jgi:hypothetical protein